MSKSEITHNRSKQKRLNKHIDKIHQRKKQGPAIFLFILAVILFIVLPIIFIIY